MYAVEFEAEAKGRIIKIPEEFSVLDSKKLKVIILLDEENMKKDSVKYDDYIGYLMNNPVTLNKSDNFFTREESNAR